MFPLPGREGTRRRHVFVHRSPDCMVHVLAAGARRTGDVARIRLDEQGQQVRWGSDRGSEVTGTPPAGSR